MTLQPHCDRERRRVTARRGGLVLAVVAGALAMLFGSPRASAQTPATQAAPQVAVPGFWDPRRRPERPDTSRISQIRFLTEFDYPPFNYAARTEIRPASMSSWRG